MQDLNDKSDGTTTLSAAEWNQLPSEVQNIIENAGQVLSSGDLNQLGKGVAHYAANGTFYTDSGAADAYSLSTISTNQAPPAYVNGMEVEFIATNVNTGGAATVNVAGLGVKSIKTRAGTDPVAGDIPLTVVTKLKYDGTNFVIYTVTDASDTIAGLIEIATAAEVNALSSTTLAVTPGRIPIASETQQGVVERATQAEVDTGTDPTRYVSPATLEGKLGSAVSGFVNGVQTYIENDVGAISQFDIDAVIGAAWESVGPTGSGATNIYTALDSLPASTQAVIIKVFASADNNATSTVSAAVFGRKTGSAAANNATSTLCQALFIDGLSATHPQVGVYSPATIPLDANNRFDLYFSNSAGTPDARMFLVGFIN